jgi:hypothetical protein
MLATPKNMSLYADDTVIAYSPLTGEETSATAGDYWMMRFDEPLLDSEGEPMILARRFVTFVEVGVEGGL